jgi:hypothetical protein
MRGGVGWVWCLVLGLRLGLEGEVFHGREEKRREEDKKIVGVTVIKKRKEGREAGRKEKCAFLLIDECCDLPLHGNRAVLNTDVDVEKVNARRV